MLTSAVSNVTSFAQPAVSKLDIIHEATINEHIKEMRITVFHTNNNKIPCWQV